jgi:hypothetical protein
MLVHDSVTGPLILRPTVVATVIDEGAILLDLQTKYFYRLNDCGWAIVQLLEAGAALEEIKSRCRSWGAKTDADDAAITHFVDILRAEGLITAGPGAPNPQADFSGSWTTPVVERQAEPLHRLVSSAFDPSIPLAE